MPTLEKVQALEAEWHKASGIASEYMDKSRKKREALDKAVTAYLEDKYGSIVVLSHENLKELGKYIFDNTTAHNIVTKWMGQFNSAVKYDGVIPWTNQDENDPDYGYYPCPRVMLKKNQDVSEVAEVLQTLALTIREKPVYISVFEKTLSEFGSYGIDYDYKEDKAILHKTTYGRREDLLTGSLEEVLKRCAKDYWYENSSSD